MPKKELAKLLARAIENEKKYDWVAAIDFYQRVLENSLQQCNSTRIIVIIEKIGYCFHRAAMQAKSRNEFEKRMKLAIEAYQRARKFYGTFPDSTKAGRESRNQAIEKYLNYWLASSGAEKIKLLNECLEFEEKALTQFDLHGNMLEYCITYNSLWLVFFLRGFLEWDFHVLLQLIQKGIEWGKKAISAMSELDNLYEIAWTNFVYGSCLSFIASVEGIGVAIVETEEAEKNYPKAVAAIEKSLFLSEKLDDALLKGLSHLWLGYHMGQQKASQLHYEKALELGIITHDHFLIGLSQAAIAVGAFWQSCTDPAKGINSLEIAKELYDKSQQHNSIINHLNNMGGELVAPQGHATYFREKAIGWGSDPKKRLKFLKMGEKAAVEALTVASLSGIPRAIAGSVHCLSYCLSELARLETDLDKRKALLKKAISHREQFIRIVGQMEPFGYSSLGVGWSHLAENKARFAEIESNLQVKEQFLKEAVEHSERSLEQFSKMIPYWERIGDFKYLMVLGRIMDRFVATLTDLHGLTRQSDVLRRTIELLHSSIKLVRKHGVIELEATSYWKLGRAQDALEEYLDASESFKVASISYLELSKRSPQVKDFYEQQAFYMEAWHEIERAKEAHTKKDYVSAKTHYEKAANLHALTMHWSYLVPNYLAWAQLEAAENVSRDENPEKAKESFLKALELFKKAGLSIKPKLKTVLTREEKELASVLLKASSKRREYCLGRISLEEARIQDKGGNHLQSSRKYELAAKIFEIMTTEEDEQSKRELLPIFYLCKAWSRMMIAEEIMSSKAFNEAAELFNQAKEYSFDRETGLLALANSSFCKALASGTKFEITRNLDAYSDAKKHMEAAENCYLKAGFTSASEYAKATLLLLDGYMYITKAEMQTEPIEKTKYYSMAERTLNASVDSYLRAKRPEKNEEVQELLENIIEKRQLVMSLMEVLPDPEITTTTKLFSAPTPTYEEAIGFDRFEHAELQANLLISEEPTADEKIEVKLDIVNVGRQAALLVRVQGLIPTGFQATSVSSQIEIERDLINMKGKRIEPLSVDSIEIILQTIDSGIFSLKPQITYIDEIGNFKHCYPKPVTMMVNPKLELEFRTASAKKVFDYLSRSFVKDYMKQKLALQESGWRSLVQIMKNTKVSSRKIYGTRRIPGTAIFELEKRGLIEKRIFHGQRGRGGKIIKTRICYDRDIIKRLVNNKVVEK